MTFLVSESGETTTIATIEPSADFSGPLYGVSECPIVKTLRGYVKTARYQATWGDGYPRHLPTPAQLLQNYSFLADTNVFYEDYQWAWEELDKAIGTFSDVCEDEKDLDDLWDLRERSEAWVKALPRRADSSRSTYQYGERSEKNTEPTVGSTSRQKGTAGRIGPPGSSFVLGRKRDTMGRIDDVEEE